MPIKYNGKTFYKTKREVEKVRRKGDRVYYVKGIGYYIVRPQSRSWF